MSMCSYDVTEFGLILLIGILFIMMSRMEKEMDKFNQAIARLQDSANKSNSKIDSLLIGQDTAVKDAVNAALSSAADQVNAVSDSLDSKNQ